MPTGASRPSGSRSPSPPTCSASGACAPFHPLRAPDLLDTLRLAVVPPTILLPLLTASLSAAPAAFTATSANPGNVLGTLRVDPPPWLTATAVSGTVDLQWGTSPTAAARDVAYAVLRRQVGSSLFVEIARTSAVTFTDAPPPSTFDYVVRTVASSFASADSPIATATTGP